MSYVFKNRHGMLAREACRPQIAADPGRRCRRGTTVLPTPDSMAATTAIRRCHGLIYVNRKYFSAKNISVSRIMVTFAKYYMKTLHF